MPKIAVIADANTALAFKALGAAIFDAPDKARAEEALDMVMSDAVDLVFIAEDLQPVLQGKLDDNPSLVYLFIPPIRGATGAGARIMEEIVQKTVGVKH